MNWPVTFSWWESTSREELQARAKREAPRMAASKIGNWRAINAELDSPRRTKRGPVVNEQGDEQ